jgi:hypothetical protein
MHWGPIAMTQREPWVLQTVIVNAYRLIARALCTRDAHTFMPLESNVHEETSHRFQTDRQHDRVALGIPNGRESPRGHGSGWPTQKWGRLSIRRCATLCHFFSKSVYLVMHWSDSNDQKENNGSADRPSSWMIFSSLVPPHALGYAPIFMPRTVHEQPFHR